MSVAAGTVAALAEALCAGVVLGMCDAAAHVFQDLPEDLPLVDVDRLLVVQALANLLETAARFAPEGTPPSDPPSTSTPNLAGDPTGR